MLNHLDRQGKSVSQKEEETLKFWDMDHIFEKSLDLRKDGDSFVFYDGPPFATGLPHYGHLLASIIKDVIPRYQTMRGKYIPRRWGWDCHGLPVENIVEQNLGLKSKKDITDYGIDKFNQAAKKEVLKYVDDWKKIIPRVGRWADMEHDYKTMDPTYTETVWWIFKTLYDKGLIEEGYKSMHLCPRCETTLSNFEVAQGYKDIEDIAVTVKFELVDLPAEASAKEGEPKTYILAWTTTPWTLPGNVALAVGTEIDYMSAHVSRVSGSHPTIKDGETYIFAATDNIDKRLLGAEAVHPVGDSTRATVSLGNLVIELDNIQDFKGSSLVGKTYNPPFDYFVNDPNVKNKENGWKIYAGDFVNTEEGTGVVHIAPAFGDEDMELGKKHNLPFIQHVTRDGKFVPGVKDFAGRLVKPKDQSEQRKIDGEILDLLKKRWAYFSEQELTHSYPHCWRCDTPLLNYAASSWFVMVTKIKDTLITTNKEISWTPEHLKEGRFGKGLETAPDWAISRSRFWGAPLPVWRCEDCEKIEVAGSLQDLEARRHPASNTFVIIRHGERDDVAAEDANETERQNDIVIHSYTDANIHLSEEGKKHVANVARTLNSKGGIDVIISSPFARAKESAEILSAVLSVPVEYDERLKELDHGSQFEGKTVGEYRAFYSDPIDRFTRAPEGGETLNDVRRRMVSLVRELDSKYDGKKILVVGHGDPLWMLEAGLKNWSSERTLAERKTSYIEQAEVRELIIPNYPFNNDGEVDFHRPFIDAVYLKCGCGARMTRIPEVFDCWFESGSMPYGEQHFMGNPLPEFDPASNRGFPADFIAEGLDQTRGWFYSLHVLATALFGKPAYKHVLANGIVLAEDGQKMSKRLKNYPDPMEVTAKYGADALRLYLMLSPAVYAEDLNFSEKGVDEVMKKVIARFENILSFYEMYKSGALVKEPRFDHVLDKYIAYEVYRLAIAVERALESYRLDRASRHIADFIDLFSTVYLQYSRDRFKERRLGREDALATLAWAVRESARILAPFMPFLAERVYQAVKESGDVESVHLADWPVFSEHIREFEAVAQEMEIVREAIEFILAERASAGISVRQPLTSCVLKRLPRSEEYREIIRKRVNVEELKEGGDIPDGKNVFLDITITPELREQGMARGFVRGIQEIRKRNGMTPGDKIKVFVFSPSNRPVLVKFKDRLEKIVGALEIEFKDQSPSQDDGYSVLSTGDSARIEKVP